MRIGIDLGGTKISGLALGRGGRELARLRVATPQGDYRATVAAIAGVVAELERASGARGSVGVGIPGTLSRASGLVKNANSTCLIGQPLDRDLAAALGRPVRLANDADCFALSEATDGAAAGVPVVFGVIIGTGTGGGVVVAGRLLQGVNGIAGEWGHNPLPGLEREPQPPPLCYCGRRGCVETWLSGPGLSARFRERSGRTLTPERLAAAAAAGDGEAEAELQRYEARFARAIAGVINIIDPHVVVLGGGLSHLHRLYANVPRLWGEHIFSDRVETRLLPARHGSDGGVRGAAWLWREAEVEEGRG